jgi:hypothetical protein
MPATLGNSRLAIAGLQVQSVIFIDVPTLPARFRVTQAIGSAWLGCPRGATTPVANRIEVYEREDASCCRLCAP